MTIATDILRVKGLGRKKLSQLEQKAKRLGTTPEKYVKRLVEDDLAITQAARTQTFAEIMGPGEPVDEEELDRVVERAKARYFEKTQGKKKR